VLRADALRAASRITICQSVVSVHARCFAGARARLKRVPLDRCLGRKEDEDAGRLSVPTNARAAEAQFYEVLRWDSENAEALRALQQLGEEHHKQA